MCLLYNLGEKKENFNYQLKIAVMFPFKGENNMQVFFLVEDKAPLPPS